MLTPYRVLDLTDDKGLLCGKVLGDLGADVIKIERPGGDPCRDIGPFYQDIHERQNSLYWLAFNTNKRGMTFDLETLEGREILKKLVRTSDFLIESFPPGYMNGHGIGYSSLREVNPGLIMVSITPFGQGGPYRDYKGSNLVAEAMGGLMSVTGERDRLPVSSGFQFAYSHAGLQAATGALIALSYRERTGQGQHIDVSIQETVVGTLQLAPYLWYYTKTIQPRVGAKTTWGEKGGTSQVVYPCKDGYILWRMYTAGLAWQTRNLVEWMKEERFTHDLTKKVDEVDWPQVDMDKLSKQQMAEWEGIFAGFFLTKKKRDLFPKAIEKGTMVFPLYNASDLFRDPQLEARDFWIKARHPELKATLIYPGIPAKSSEVSFKLRPPPLIGEHNQEIYEELENLPKEQRAALEKPRIEGKDLDSHEQALAGLKVLDLGWVFAGPFGPRFLGDYGATVIKVESFKRVDPLRPMSPYAGGKAGINRGVYFLWHNPNKYSVSIDYQHPKGLELLKKLIAWADVVVENFTPGTLEKLGLGYEDLKNINPGVILVRVSAAGQQGPHALMRGLGQMLKGLSGLANTGLAGQIPTPNPVAHTDFTAGYYFTCVTLAALDYRKRTGKDQCIDGSQIESAVIFYSPAILDYVANKRIQGLMGNRVPHAAPHNAYRCEGDDRWCVLSVFNDEEWKAFCNVIGNPPWASDTEYFTLEGRKEHEDELDRLIEAWTTQHTPEEVMETMQKVGVAAGVVKNAKDLFEDPQLQYRDHFQYAEHSEVGQTCYSTPSYKLAQTPPEIRLPSPCLGEHTEFICREILGMDDEEFVTLVQEEVLT